MKHVTLPLIVALLLTSSAVASMSFLPVSQAQPTTLLSVDFTGTTLPAGWLLQGSAKFVGGLDASTGVGGLQLTSGSNVEGAIVYETPLTTQNIIIEISGMYAPSDGATEAEDIGVGFYSGGPSPSFSGLNPASPNGYYAAYEFYWAWNPALMYNAKALSSGVVQGGKLPSTGLNYLFTETIITPSSISMNALARTDSPWMNEPSISLGNVLTYNNATGIDSSHSTFYVGGASCSGADCSSGSAIEYVYWLRILTNSTPNSSATATSSTSEIFTQPQTTQFVTQTVISSQPPLTQTQSVTQTVIQGQTTPTPVLSTGGANSVLLYAVIGAVVVVAVVLVGVFLALRSRGHRGTATPTYGAPMFCKSCGSPLSGLERYCDRCGAPQV